MFFVILISYIIPLIIGCKIAGEQIGYCTEKFKLNNDSFCGNFVSADICVPKTSVAWSQYSSLAHRDRQIQDIFVFYIENRLLEEYIYLNATTQIISNNQNCYDSYKQLLCQFNFPPCNFEKSQTLPICKSICTNFFINCMSSSDACDIIYAKKSPGLDSTC